MNRRGLTLVEVLIVIGIVLILFAIVVPMTWRSQVHSGRGVLTNNLRQCGVAVHTAVGDYKKLPPAFGHYGEGFGKRAGRNQPATLFVHLLPYLEQLPAYDQGVQIFLPTFHYPNDPTDTGQSAGTCMVANAAIFSDNVEVALGGRGGTGAGCSLNLSKAMPDGTSNVIMFATGAIDARAGQPRGVRDYAVFHEGGGGAFSSTQAISMPQWSWNLRTETANPMMFQPFHKSGISVCMGDANIRTVDPSVSVESWTAAMTPDDGKYPGSDF